MADKKTFLEAVSARHTYYALSNESTIPDSKIKDIVVTAIKDTPSAFNSQTTRLVVSLNKEHEKLWDIILDVYKQRLTEEKFNHLKGKIQSFRGAYGTILFYEDQVPVHEMQEKSRSYASYFPQWSEHTNAMHQYVLWTALEAEGFGCNLQHYNPPIDSRLAAEYKLPDSWVLKAQMVFGKPTGDPAGGKTFQPIEDRVKFYGVS